MRVVTWNVNGLRAALRNGFRDWAITHPADIYCIQEVKARPDQVAVEEMSLPGYEAYWNPAQRPGYSGVLTYTRHQPVAVTCGFGVEKFDQEGRVVRIQLPEYHLYNIYFPNGQRGKDRVDYKLEFYSTLLEEIKGLHAAGENVIVTGDFNTAHREIDLARPKENSKTSGFLPEERFWVETLLSHGLVDAFRALYPERIQYTWWAYWAGGPRRKAGGWRIDYFLVSEPLMDRVQDVVFYEDAPCSDHIPVELVIQGNSHSHSGE